MARRTNVEERSRTQEEAGTQEEGSGRGVKTSGVRPIPDGTTGGDVPIRDQVLAVYDQVESDLARMLVARGVPRADVEVVLQGIFVALLRWWKKEGRPLNPPGLAFEIAETQRLLYFRERSRHPLPRTGEPREEAVPESRGSVERQMLHAERVQRIHEALDKMPRDEADLIRWVHYKELPQTRIAQMLGITVAAASSRYLRALARLEKLVRCHCSQDDLGGDA